VSTEHGEPPRVDICVPESNWTLTSKIICETRNIGTRIKGRPRKRWIEDIEDDIQIMGIRGWRKLCKERAEWRRITEKSETHIGL
jgi:hypothetical protein